MDSLYFQIIQLNYKGIEVSKKNISVTYNFYASYLPSQSSRFHIIMEHERAIVALLIVEL